MKATAPTSEKLMSNSIKDYIDEVVESPDDFDFEGTAIAKELLKYYESNQGTFAEAVAMLIFSSDIDFSKKNPWQSYFDMPWVGAVLQNTWNTIDWQAVYNNLPPRTIKRFLKIVAKQV